tara:strand:+ start:4505 stop:5413 length:909 start_codon:yes stop_codon:yes gene_type:complete
MIITQDRSTINTLLVLVVWFGILSTGNTTELPQDKEDINQSFVSFQVFSETPQDTKLIQILEETQTYHRIKKIIETNFILEKPVRLHIQHPKEAQLIATELSQQSYVVVLPFSFLHALYQGLSNKYEHQRSAIDTIFSTTVEFYIWSEFAGYLIKEKNLEIKGQPYTTKDNFAAIMLLNQNNANSDFIADASEAYLLIHNAGESNVSQHMQNELQRDQQRYRHIICLTMGFNQAVQQADIERDHLESFSWDESEIEQCKKSYLIVLSNWYEAIETSLQENNIIQTLSITRLFRSFQSQTEKF